MKRLQQIARESYVNTESNLYAVNSEMSHVSKEFAAGDPNFWTPMTIPAAKPRGRKGTVIPVADQSTAKAIVRKSRKSYRIDEPWSSLTRQQRRAKPQRAQPVFPFSPVLLLCSRFDVRSWFPKTDADLFQECGGRFAAGEIHT